MVEGHLNTLYLQALAAERANDDPPAMERRKSELGARQGIKLRYTFNEPTDFVVPEDVTEVLVRIHGAESGLLGSTPPQDVESVASVTPGATVPVEVGHGGTTPFGGRAPNAWAEVWW